MKCPACHEEHDLEVYPGDHDSGKIKPGLSLLYFICPRDDTAYGVIPETPTEFSENPSVKIIEMISVSRLLYGAPFI